jgi:hypothetical protein
MHDDPTTTAPDPDGHTDDDRDDEAIDPLEGLMDPEAGDNTPAGDTDAPPPPG